MTPFARLTRAARAALPSVSLTLLAAGCAGEGTAPSPASKPSLPAIAVNDTLARELRTPTQVDTLRLVASGPLLVHVDLQHLAPTATQVRLRFALVDSARGTTVVETAGSAGPGEQLGFSPDWPFHQWTRLPAAGTYLLLVSSTAVGEARYVGPYRVRLLGTDTRAEGARETLAPNDSVAAAIDAPGDVDDFVLAFGAGAPDLVLAVRALSGRATDTVIVEAVGAGPFLNGTELLRSAGSDPTPRPTYLGQLDGRRDTVRVRVRGRGTAAAAPYRLTFYQVNRAPERAPRAVVAGDTVSEALDYARDIDEFTFVGDPGREYALAFQGTSGSAADRLTLEAPGAASLTTTGVGGPLLASISNRFAPGSYTIRVQGQNDDVPRGGYRFAVVPIDPKPESAPAVIALGDTVGERIDLRPDLDEFSVPVRQGDHFVIYSQLLTADTSARLEIEPFDIPGGNVSAYGWFDNELRAVPTDPPAPLRATRTKVFAAGATGVLRIRVRGIGGFAAPTYVGAYRLAVARIDPGTEGPSPRLTLGVPVRGVLDPAGDVDAFTFDGVAGQEVAAYVSASGGAPGGRGGAVLSFTLADGGWSYLAGGPSAPAPAGRPLGVLEGGGTGLFKLSASGPNRVAVVGAALAGESIPYEVVVVTVDRAPEQAPATLRLGDAVEDVIAPSVDVDEYRVVGPAGARFQACLSSRPNAAGFEGTVYVLVDGAGVEALSTATAAACSVPRAIPASGVVTLSARATSLLGMPYRLEIRALP